MANPQLENGYTKISNELLEAILDYGFSAYELRIYLFIIRKSYGWGEKVVYLTTGQIAKETNIHKANVNRTLKRLLSSNRLRIEKKDYKRGASYSIQKDYDKWKPKNRNKKIVVKKTTNCSQKDYKQKITPIILKKERKGTKKSTPAPDEFPVTDQMRSYASRKGYTGDLKNMTEKFLKRHQAKGSKFKDWYKAWQTWLLNEMDFNPSKFSRPPPESADPFNGDRFLKTANHLLTTPGYTENDFSSHCYGHGQDPRIVKQKLIKLTGGIQ